MRIIKPAVVYKCKTHKILPDAIWGTETDLKHQKSYFYCYSCPKCPDMYQYYYLAYGSTKAQAEEESREYWNELQ